MCSGKVRVIPVYIIQLPLNPKTSKTDNSSLGSCDISLLLMPLGSKIWNLYTLEQSSSLIPLKYST